MISKCILFPRNIILVLNIEYPFCLNISVASLLTKCFHPDGRNGSNKNHYHLHDLGGGDSSAVQCHALHHHNPSPTCNHLGHALPDE